MAALFACAHQLQTTPKTGGCVVEGGVGGLAGGLGDVLSGGGGRTLDLGQMEVDVVSR